MTTFNKILKYFLIPAYLGTGYSLLWSGDYLQAQVEFLWAVVFLVIIVFEVRNGSSGSTQIIIDVPKGCGIVMYTSGGGCGGIK